MASSNLFRGTRFLGHARSKITGTDRSALRFICFAPAYLARAEISRRRHEREAWRLFKLADRTCCTYMAPTDFRYWTSDAKKLLDKMIETTTPIVSTHRKPFLLFLSLFSLSELLTVCCWLLWKITRNYVRVSLTLASFSNVCLRNIHNRGQLCL